MKTDFGKLIKDTFDFTWKYKVLWFFGFLVALFSSGSSFSNSSSRSNSRTNSGSSTFDMSQYPALDSFIHSPAFWITLVVIVVVIIAIALIGWYLSSVGYGAITRGVKKDSEGNGSEITFKNMWSIGNSYALKVMLLGLLWGVIIFAIILVLLLPIILMELVVGPAAILLFCCAFIVIFPLLIVLGVLITTSRVLLIYYDLGIWESITESWNLIRTEWKDVLVGALIQLLFAIPIGLIVFIVFIVLLIPAALFLFFIFSTTQNLILVGILGLILFILISALAAAAESPFIVFATTYWVKLISGLRK